ncbi:D-alanyl-D-alanine carboxypeptidase family protein [Nitrosomonas ureae]|uniref:D-alanyl-D-alanine carboxypeptidase n=1 Tax=Nitrosomonas ureae TaxID=44577 RepID=A0A1H5UUM9_9PROT|nr:D-alanyl-D-alanine carboxypeptidase family protein [Nitrosomonas ureae]SEF78842.1 D-alanyl-D-alanine carboxypeptidase [Nitrosomonas ureae]
MLIPERDITTRMYVFAIFLLLLILSGSALANPRYSSIVIDADTRAVLHESSADASRYPASLTKMMTLYMLFEAMEQRKMTVDTRMPVSAHAAAMPQTNIGLRTGDSISVRDAIPALIVRSANDVAAVVAEALGRSEANFGRMMTDKARQLGMRSTTFRNASGLPNLEQKTTARDMVILSTRLMKDFPKYYHYFSTQSFSYKGVTYNSHNRMVRNTSGVDGLKTGFIRASGFNVATSAKRGNRRVIAVVMGGNTAAARDQHMARLIDRSFNQGNRTTQVASNSKNARAIAVTAVKVNAPTPALKPYPEQSKVSESIVTQQYVIPPVSAQPVQLQKVALQANDDWGVQIGSYHEPSRAHAHAQAAARWIPGEVAVTEVEISNRRLYRARLVGLQENQARSACQSLMRQGIECLVVRS